MKRFIKNCAELIFDMPTRIVYMFRYWEYVDWRVQTVFYIIVLMLMLGVLGAAQGKWW